MPWKSEDLTGQRFGTVVVLRQVPHETGSTRWDVLCDCGRVYTTKSGIMKSAIKARGHYSCKHCRDNGRRLDNSCRSEEYAAWNNMKTRCYNPSYAEWSQYGGRGITVCDRWLESYDNFFSDMGPKPSQLHSLDRINNDAAYSPENCRWATKKEQGYNRSDNLMVEYLGVTKCMAEWAQELGISYKVLMGRYHRQKDRGERLFRPVAEARKDVLVEYRGSAKNLSEWARETGIGRKTLSDRYLRGDRGERLFRPVRHQRSS
jgi:hypothetical protein